MYELEIFLFIVFLLLTFVYLYKWYNRISKVWKPMKTKLISNTLGYLPLLCFFIIFITLKLFASFDVVDSFFYLTFYILFGIVWMFIGIKLLFYFFNLSVVDDVLNNRNKAALYAISGGAIGITLIYSGANIGDGPGFWCVFVAGGLGIVAWVILVLLVNVFSKVLDNVLINRDISSGVRFGCFLIATGIIFGRASGGDWTSFSKTIIEFMDGWIVLPLGVLFVLIEKYYINKAKIETFSSPLKGSIAWGLFYIIVAIVSVIYIIPPFVENPIYDVMLGLGGII